MIIDNEPILSRYFCPPKELAQLSGSGFMAGVIEALMENLGFVSFSMANFIEVQSDCTYDSFGAFP